jgi:hypothetical protein
MREIASRAPRGDRRADSSGRSGDAHALSGLRAACPATLEGTRARAWAVLDRTRRADDNPEPLNIGTRPPVAIVAGAHRGILGRSSRLVCKSLGLLVYSPDVRTRPGAVERPRPVSGRRAVSNAPAGSGRDNFEFCVILVRRSNQLSALSNHDHSPDLRPSPEAEAIFQVTKGDLRQRLLIALFAGAFAALILWLWGIGSFHDSREYWRVSWRIWTGVAAVVGVVLYPHFASARSSKTDEDVRPSVIAAVVASAATSIGLTLIYAASAPHIMHRFDRVPVQLETTVLERRISDGKGGRCLYLETPVSRQYVTVLFCVDQRTYANAHSGQRIRVDGFQSWFGMEFKGYAVLDT